ncbi:MAG TPA: hypothetical protein VEK56_06630 [Vicinamibacterales bacterium]|nr:hypothetical protein [Vicinamibacterales bacterium]
MGHLRYAFRIGTLTGVAGGRLVHVLTRSTPDHVAAWEKQQELRTGQWRRRLFHPRLATLSLRAVHRRAPRTRRAHERGW